MPAAAVTAPTTGPPMRKPAPAAVTADDVAMFSSFTGTSAVDDSARRDTDRAADAADGAFVRNEEAQAAALRATLEAGAFFAVSAASRVAQNAVGVSTRLALAARRVEFDANSSTRVARR